MAIKVVDEKITPAEMGGEVLETAEPEDELPAQATEPTPHPPASKPEDLSIEDLQYLLEQKRLQVAKQAQEDAKPVKAPTKAPQGMVWVFNRAPQPFSWQYDGLVYEIAGHDMMLLPERIARHGRKRSLVSLDPIENTAVFKLALEDEPKFGHPLRIVNRLELIDRTHDNNPLGAALTVPTRLTALKVSGAAESMTKRRDSFVELE